ncbi:ATP-binding protein [bacterium]|nr:ATP-binding protein [bacterium]
MSTIKPKDRDTLIQALRAGVVPRSGQHLIQVGRVREVEGMLKDIERVASGGSAFRIVVGEYGAGKTFFLNLVRSIALQKKLVTMHADLNPDRRLHASGGQARSLYAELTKNTSTMLKPEGGALTGVVEKFVAQCKSEAKASGGDTEKVVREKLAPLTELVNGFDFADVLVAYYRGFEQGNDQLKSDAVRWLRGEFTTRTDARNALGVRAIVDDSTVYDQLKLLAQFVRLAGYHGLLVCLDECVNLYKLANTQARNSNYEQILRILNDSLQGSADGLGFILGGTPEFLMDTRRGLYSYPALQSRLAQNTFAKDGLLDLSGPVLRLTSLTPEDFFLLLTKIIAVFANGHSEQYLLPEEAVPLFMEHCARRLGEEYFRTPRTTITAFVNLLAILEQNAGTEWRPLIGGLQVEEDRGAEAEMAAEEDDELASFQL